MGKINYLKHLAVIGIGIFLNMFLGLLTTPIITRLVEPEEYGQFSLFTMYSGIALMILCLGLDQSLVRYYYEKDNDDYRRALLFKCIVLPVILGIVVSIIVVTLTKFGYLDFGFDIIMMLLLCIYTIFQLIYRFSLLLIRLAYNSKLFSVLNTIQKISYVLIVLPLLILIEEYNLLILAIASIIAIFICILISIISQKNLWDIRKCEVPERLNKTKELLTYGAPFIISMGVTTIFQAIDKLSLNYYCTYSEVGIYASTMSLVNIFAIIQTTFNALWTPMSVEHYTKNKKDKYFYQKGNQLITIIMFFAGITIILCKDLFTVLLGEQYREAAYILPFLIFNPIMYTISETTVCGLVFMKKSKMQVVVAVVACFTNIVGNSILVPRLGCQGAAISTGISYIVFFTMRTVLSNYYFYINYRLKAFYTLTGIVFLYALYNTFTKFNLGSIVGYFICLAALVFLYQENIKWGIHYLADIAKSVLHKK